MFHLKKCLAKESASLKIPCSDVSLKLSELVLPDEPSSRELPRRAVVGVFPGDGAPLRVKFSSNRWEKLPWVRVQVGWEMI